MIRHLLGAAAAGISGRVNAARDLFGTLSATGLPTGVIVARTVATPYATNTNLATVLPSDNTVPLDSEGTSVLSVAHTMKAASNRLVIRFNGFGSVDNAGGGDICAALFSSTATTALTASVSTVGSANQVQNIGFQHEYSPGVTTAVTLSVRFGPGAGGAGNARLNGTAAARLFGGVAAAQLIIEEVQA